MHRNFANFRFNRWRPLLFSGTGSGRDVGALQPTKIIGCKFPFPRAFPRLLVHSVREDEAVLQGIHGKGVADVRGHTVHRLEEGIRRQAPKSPRPREEVDKVQAVPGTLRLRQWELHQGSDHPRAGSVQDHHHRQLPAGVRLPCKSAAPFSICSDGRSF